MHYSFIFTTHVRIFLRTIPLFIRMSFALPALYKRLGISTIYTDNIRRSIFLLKYGRAYILFRLYEWQKGSVPIANLIGEKIDPHSMGFCSPNSKRLFPPTSNLRSYWSITLLNSLFCTCSLFQNSSAPSLLRVRQTLWSICDRSYSRQIFDRTISSLLALRHSTLDIFITNLNKN